MTRWLNQLQPWGIFLLRIVLGLAMLIHSIPDFLRLAGVPFHIHAGSSIHGAVGLPHWFYTFSTLTEFFGGLFLVLGLLTRFSAFLLTIDLLSLLLFAEVHRGYTASEYHLALAAIAFLLLLTGPGKSALDRKLGLL
ncbi:MAG TPA: DoxX family membrane protein [Acidobacteriaceae bacterium]|nr:DoxX family membrane protein [Acidobacteriaceae bacterium]